jgi:hypothetical protein
MKAQQAVILNGCYTPFQKRIVTYAYERIKQCNPYNKSRHCSVLCKGKDIICYGINNEESRYTHRFGYLSNHAEYEAVRRFLRFRTLKDLEKMTMYNCRINRYNEVVNSRPCRKCSQLLIFFPVKNLFYTDEVGGFQQWQS